MSNFHKYSAYYDLLYADKDYAAEADYVARALGPARSVLELGSGTGRHGRLLAERGFDVQGVELSPEMAAEAQSQGRVAAPSGAGSFACEVGDLRTFRAGRTFDAVISLFHVISYQTGNDDLSAAFRTAADHLSPGGIFLFDVWHGPAVLAQQPERRTKQAADAARRVRRTATPTLDTNASTVRVDYDVTCEDLATGETARFGEEHLMRYLFPTEIGFLAAAAGFTQLASEEFLTSHPPSPDTWGVAYLLSKQ
ncbi:MAG TPA: class I SAM-dependent methyltransferase [Caulobacteraceae bacterium]|nr:class I SAM-dependent methyltransferase [Caulobacteraceae bacterium]